ncbi:MAG: N-formylglutamate amidohydrolase [Halioglobus sp.]
MDDAFIVTCEHGGNRIPAAYRGLFRGKNKLLSSHFGFDPGALHMAKALAGALDAPLLASTTSRLLIDLNRPSGHRHLYSAVTRNVPAEMHAEIVSKYYQPYLAEVEQRVGDLVERGKRVIHIASHSFTPELNGVVRRADVGLLYRPNRRSEKQLCARWKAKLAECAPTLKVRRNYPYCGKAAGLTEQLRRRFSADHYVGIELEVNQHFVTTGGRRWSELCRVLPQSLVACMRGTRVPLQQ